MVSADVEHPPVGRRMETVVRLSRSSKAYAGTKDLVLIALRGATDR